MTVPEHPEPIDPSPFATPAAPQPSPSKPDGEPTKPRGRRGSPIIRYGLPGCLLVCVVTLGTVFWLETRGVLPKPASDPYRGLDERERRYVDAAPASAEIVTDEVRAAFAALEADFKRLDEDIEAARDHLQVMDPHVRRAIRGGLSVPLVGDRPPQTLQQLTDRRACEIDSLVEDYMQNSSDGAAEKKVVGPILRDVLWNSWTGRTVDEQQRKKLADRYRSGNRDPLLLYAMLIHEDRGSHARYKLITECLKAMDSQRRSPYLRAMVSPKMVEFKALLKSHEYARAQVQAREDVLEVIAAHADSPDSLAPMIDRFTEIYRSFNGWGRADMFLAAMERDDAEFPRWMKHYVASLLANSIAAHYRGSGFISSVPQQSLVEFQKYTDIAGKHLLKAWVLDPTNTRLINALLNAERWAGSTGIDAHEWFRYALMQAYDDPASYLDYAVQLYPRWGGSEDELIKFAQLCVSVDRPDTLVPFFARHPLEEVFTVRVVHLPFDDDPRLLALAKRIVACLKTTTHPHANAAFAGSVAGMTTRILWDWGEFEDLQWILDNHAEAVTPSMQYQLLMNVSSMKSICDAAMRSEADAWRRLHYTVLMHPDELTDRDTEAARKLIGQIRAGGVDDTTEIMLTELEQILDWAESYRRGEVVELVVDEIFTGWMAIGLQVKACEGGMEVVVSRSQNLGLAFPMIRFPGAHAIEADFEVVGTTDDFFGLGLMAGPTGNQLTYDAHNGQDLRYRPGQFEIVRDELPWNTFHPNGSSPQATPLKQTGKTHFRVEVRDWGIRTVVNGTELDERPGPVETHGIVQIGRHIQSALNYTSSSPTTYRVTNLRVQRLDDPEAEESPSTLESVFDFLLY